jgi:acyl carrier protein
MPSTRTDILSIISQCIEVPPDRVMQAQSLADLEIDSLGLIDIIFELEKKLSIEIPDKLISNVASLDDLVFLVEQVLMSRSDLQTENA